MTTQKPSTSSYLYTTSNFVSYNSLKPTYSTCLTTYSSEVEPQSYQEASRDPKWIKDMLEEILALKENHTWSIVTLPLDKHPIGCKWVFKIMYKAFVELERYKAKLVAKGYTQQEGQDYTDTFSPVAKIVTDGYNAFLQENLEKEVYMTVPAGFSSQVARQGDMQVCRLHKSPYGFK